MIKVSLALLTVAVLVASHPTSRPTGRLDIAKQISENGYPVEVHYVTTKDGYILDIIRIPSGYSKKDHQQQNQQQQQQQSQSDESSQSSESSQNNFSNEKSVKPAVFLMHGFMSSSEDFIYGGPKQGLAYVLADQGYDVYLGNARGSRYGLRHTTLDPSKDAAFWKFCWDQIATEDLPVIIDKVLKISGKDKLKYIGHMEGATEFLVLTAERPEYNEKIERMIALGPIAYLKDSTNKMLKMISEKLDSESWIMKHVGLNTFRPSTKLTTETIDDCLNIQPYTEVCDNSYFLLNGYQSTNLNKATLKKALLRVPFGGSVREVLHFAQLYQTGQFAKLNPVRSDSVEYDLSKITVPVAILNVPTDSFSVKSDVEYLKNQLDTVFEYKSFTSLTNNLDLLYSRNVYETVYKQVLTSLKKNVNQNRNVSNE